MEACTATALDAITAFAVPNPNCLSPGQSVFSGLVAPQIASRRGSLSLLRTGEVLLAPTLSAINRIAAQVTLPTISFCEEAVRLETCTTAAPNATTACAVPNPGSISQRRRFFRVRLLFGSPRRAARLVYFGLTKSLCVSPFDRQRSPTLARKQSRVNARFLCNCGKTVEMAA